MSVAAPVPSPANEGALGPPYPDELAVIINDSDSLSVATGNYYAIHRAIPAVNVLHVRLPREPALAPLVFERSARLVEAQLSNRVQFLALAWTEPYRVGCMSVTSAFALGYDSANCTSGCRLTPLSPYFDSDSRFPYRDFHMRPAMLLAASDWAHAKALINRGIDSDDSTPFGTAYLLDTSDRARDVRAATFVSTSLYAPLSVNIQIVEGNEILNRDDVLFYFTGVPWVHGLETLRFLPGAIADHLTSYGGDLAGWSAQMSSLAWLEAGATGSYGTVVEPCDFPGKFPDIPIVIRRYLAGETLIEAYWKSVARPSQGVFIGEPFARPFRQSAISYNRHAAPVQSRQ
ncbi:MAG TPA: TIGR03790 family protein [Steroidobacteraceae bacterium]|nr:TIGR03790 family protein [Steroidobacteraceae bacterium]